MANFFQYFHYSVSFFYTVGIVYMLFRSYFGWIRNFSWHSRDHYMALGVVLLMYLQLILGVYLFFSQHYLSTGSSLATPSPMRFWPVEHFFVMLFALIVSQLGLVIVSNSRKASVKYRTIFVYFAISFALVLASLFMIFWGKKIGN